jgi:pimeloyl-ACP methyl ester carboxylesterase
MKLPIILLLGTFLTTSLPFAASAAANGDHTDDHIRTPGLNEATSHERVLSQALLSPALIAGTFEQPIDHSGKQNLGTFTQRYWIDSEYAAQGNAAPVIFHICGEGDAEEGYFLNDAAISWAKTLGAHLVYLEHRYYGKSLPFADYSTEHLQYLTLDNVIEDLATFQKWVIAQNGWQGKWITVGGSYSATLSAIYRQKHPELVVGALAASAPMISGVGNLEGTDVAAGELSSTDPSDDSGARPWVYQACTTFGFWEADGATPDADFMIPSSDLCQLLFPGAPFVNYGIYNQTYDAPFLAGIATAPSHILFTYGTEDIWTKIGLAEQTSENPGIVIKLINGAGHHFDLNLPNSSDSAEVVAAREEFITLAREWLK